jgi:hypothetical protein
MGLDDEGECVCRGNGDEVIVHSPGDSQSPGECIYPVNNHA